MKQITQFKSIRIELVDIPIFLLVRNFEWSQTPNSLPSQLTQNITQPSRFFSIKPNKNMSRKRDKPSYTARHVPYNYPKRRRPLPPVTSEDPPENPSPKVSAAVVVTGLSQDCSVLDLKSRFEIYGSISRTRMDPTGVAYVTFRSSESAEAAIAASRDPSFGITINSSRVS